MDDNIVNVSYKDIRELLEQAKRQEHSLTDIYRELSELGLNPTQFYLLGENVKSLPVDARKFMFFKIKYGLV